MGIRACQQSWIIRSRCWIAHVKERATPGRNYARAESSQLQAAPANPQADAADVSQITWLRLLEHVDRIEYPERVGS